MSQPLSRRLVTEDVFRQSISDPTSAGTPQADVVFAGANVGMARPNVAPATPLLWLATSVPAAADDVLDYFIRVRQVSSIVIPPPVGLTAVLSNGMVTLSVTAEPTATEYHWFQGSPAVSLGTTLEPVLTIGPLNPDTYAFTASMLVGGIETASSAPVSVTVPTVAPTGPLPGPTNLTGFVNQRAVTLNCDPYPNATEYRWYETQTVGRPVTTTAEPTRTSGQLAYGDYFYTVTAVVDGVETQPSAGVPLTVASTSAPGPLGAPTGLAATVSADRVVTLTCDPYADATEYLWYGSSRTNVLARTTTPTTNRGPLSSGNYSYSVSVIVGGVESPLSSALGVIVEATGVPSNGGTSGGSLLLNPPALTNPLTVTLSSTNRSPALDETRDYIIKAPNIINGPITLRGGRNVVWQGGTVNCPGTQSNRPIYLYNQTGRLHVEGIHITGTGLKEGMNIDQRLGATMYICNSKVDTVHGSQSGDHADVIQCWAAPANREIIWDRIDGTTQYQGYMLQPHHLGPDTSGQLFQLRNSVLRKAEQDNGGYLIYHSNSASYAVTYENMQFVHPTKSIADLHYAKNAPTPTTAEVTLRKSNAAVVPVLIGNPGVGYVRP